jgi:serine/threonine protein kinase
VTNEDIGILFQQVKNLKDLDHPGIVKVYDFFEDKKRYYIVIDICKGGLLFDLIAKKPLSELQTAIVLK